MLVYRIDRIKYTNSILSGRGAMRYGGRWNYKNTFAVYASATRALALIEILVHIRKAELMPKDRILITIEVPNDQFVQISRSSLSASWRDRPRGPDSNRDLFESEVIQNGRLGMAVPSVIIPQELNYVLDPNASSFEQVKIIDVAPLDWDNRL